MENQIILTGGKALRYRQLNDQIKEIDCVSVDCPKASDLIAIISHIFTLHGYIRDAAVALGMDENFSRDVNLEKAKDHLKNALYSIPDGLTVSNWMYEISYMTKCTEALEWFTTKVNE